MAFVTPIKVGSCGINFSWYQRVKRTHQFLQFFDKPVFVIYLMGGTYFLFSVRKVLMKTLLRESNIALASLKSALKLRASPHSRDRDRGSQMAREGGRDYSLFPFQKIYLAKLLENKENVSGQACVYSQTHSRCLIGKQSLTK